MFVLDVRNVHQALPWAVQVLKDHGIQRDSRNGPVLQMPTPVTTVYRQPLERVVFWPDRDANPFLHCYEALWMLAGRNDVAPLKRYSKQFAEYSDNGVTLHGAYGKRWRDWFDGIRRDQLTVIVNRLRANHDDRRCVLQMWDAPHDLDVDTKDAPCNDMATFQIDHLDRLHMVVFCRSNDIVWGAYGANAVHFGYLLEYMATRIGVQVGTYTQVSVNWHAYAKTFAQVSGLDREVTGGFMGLDARIDDPYRNDVAPVPMPNTPHIDLMIEDLLLIADADLLPVPLSTQYDASCMWYRLHAHVLHAHNLWATRAAPERYDDPLSLLEPFQATDWGRAAAEWLLRRRATWEAKLSAPTTA